MDMIGIQKNFSEFYLECKKCGSNDVVISFDTYGCYDDTIDEYDDEINNIMLECRNCKQKEVQDYDFIECH